MLHVRVVSPQDLTPQLVTALTAEPGVRNLVVLPGTATSPDGDAVQVDLLNESANPVLRQLRGLPHRVPGQRADRCVHLDHHAPGGRVDRPVGRVRQLARRGRLALPVAADVIILIVVGAAGLGAQRGLWHRLAGPDEGATGWRWD